MDFIDMEIARSQREVENRLREALRYDRARVQMGKISRFGLMELSRQRLRPSLEETAHQQCPRCNGIGFIRGIESTALHILRIMQEEAMKENSAAIHVQVPVDVATYLLNEKRADIHAVEARLKVNVVLIPNIHLETPHYKVERLRHDDLNQEGVLPPSYNLVEAPAEEQAYASPQEARPPRPQAAVQGVTPEEPAPIAPPRPVVTPPPPPAPAVRPESHSPHRPGIMSRLFGWLRSPEPAPATPTPAAAPARPEPQQRRDRGDRSERRDHGGERPQRGDGRDRGRDERPPRHERAQGQGRGRDGERQSRGDQQGQRDRRDRRDHRDQPRDQQRGPRPEERQRHGEQRSGEPRQERQGEPRQAEQRPTEQRQAEPRQGEQRQPEPRQGERPQQEPRMQPIGGGPAHADAGGEQDAERRRGRRNRRDRGDRGERADRGERGGRGERGDRGERQEAHSREVRLREDQLREDQLREGRLREARLSEERTAAGESRPEPMPAAEPAFTAPVAPVAAPIFESPREIPVAVTPAAPARAPEVRGPVSPPPPPIDVDRALRDSGLVMIETSRDKVQAAAAPVDELQAPRARRERRPPPADLNTPLQQVETRKSDGESPPSH
ncbi:MAG TPA: ribonuclease E/G [Burkholderiales bacterium]|nr:ribonuclease E/G [Burkholderiales bacterium]